MKELSKCKCKFEPRNVQSLVGCKANAFYEYEECFNPDTGEDYVRVYSSPTSYQCCHPTVFKKYFQPISNTFESY